MIPIKIVNNDFIHKLSISFTIGTTCNYACYYCFDECNDGKYLYPTNLELIKKNLSHMINIYRDHFSKSNIKIHVTGGEPTLWPELGEFTEYFNKEVDCKLFLSTNGSKAISFWKKYAKYFDDIHISIHNESCNPKHIIRVMDWIYNNENDVLINGTVLMDPFHWNRCIEIADELAAHPTPWVLKVRPVLLDGVLRFFSPPQLEYIEDKMKKLPPKEKIDHYISLGIVQPNEPDVWVTLEDGNVIKYDTFQFLKNDWHHFTGWNCNLGIDRFSIERNGDIQGLCGAKKLFGLDAPLNIYDPDLISKFTPDMIKGTICATRDCTCATDIRLSKSRI